MMIDCRDVPSESGCTLAIYGEPDEVVRAAVAHAVDAHGHTDDPSLHEAIRAGMRPSDGAVSRRGAFVQLIEFRTHRIDDFETTVRQWSEAIGAEATARWAITGGDRDNADHYVQIVEFPDYESAMANSRSPATGEFAERLSKICEGEATFHNLDVHSMVTF
jgi:quinol monooxygenase YgiN